MIVQLLRFIPTIDAVRKGHSHTGISRAIACIAVGFALLMAGCSANPAVVAAPSEPIPQTPPPLPFDDNPDPTLCGIPTQDNRRGIAHGEIEGELASPIIYLYESHVRQRITGQIYPGAEVQILLSQSNPTLDYHFVKTINVEPPQEGWIPAPFVAAEP